MRSGLPPAFAVAVGLGLALSANSMSLETAFASQLIRAHGPKDIARLRHRFDRVKDARAICTMQISSGQAPLACYEVLDVERAWKTSTPEHLRAKRQRLDAACASAALRLEVPDGPADLRIVSPDCAGRVKEAQATRRYRRADRGWSGD